MANKMYYGTFEYEERPLHDKSLHIPGAWNFMVKVKGVMAMVSPDGKLYVATKRLRPPNRIPVERLYEK